ncbi:hypothetical protein ACFSCX_05100 [Bacillus salitolerans]|uniref:Uncharacterized protein n=1 Tax=Bacillus salitolerans TaxID=1437434 RepID=A0ABW4LLD5_9BACI
MDYTQQIEELAFAYLQSFSNRIDKEWGILFYQEEQPMYYDANHAHIN